MKKALEFLKSNFIIVKWTIWYFFIIWFILKFIFNFNMFSGYYWWKFLHATLHGFGGFMFGIIVYSALPLYIVTTLITHRKKELIIPIPFSQTISKIFSKKTEEPEKKPENPEPESEQTIDPEFPSDLPPELRIPYQRVKNRLPLTSGVSVYNKPNVAIQKTTEPKTDDISSIPIPMDFDISDTIEPTMPDSVPIFKDLDFDIPIATEKELENNTTKYFKDKNIDFETYQNFVATEKFVIYEHNDEDFWIMDGDSWFAAGKQIDSPVKELIDLATQNDLTPVIYLASQNIMDIDNTIANFESAGIRVIKNLDELKQ